MQRVYTVRYHSVPVFLSLNIAVRAIQIFPLPFVGNRYSDARISGTQSRHIQ